MLLFFLSLSLSLSLVCSIQRGVICRAKRQTFSPTQSGTLKQTNTTFLAFCISLDCLFFFFAAFFYHIIEYRCDGATVCFWRKAPCLLTFHPSKPPWTLTPSLVSISPLCQCSSFVGQGCTGGDPLSAARVDRRGDGGGRLVGEFNYASVLQTLKWVQESRLSLFYWAPYPTPRQADPVIRADVRIKASFRDVK